MERNFGTVIESSYKQEIVQCGSETEKKEQLNKSSWQKNMKLHSPEEL